MQIKEEMLKRDYFNVEKKNNSNSESELTIAKESQICFIRQKSKSVANLFTHKRKGRGAGAKSSPRQILSNSDFLGNKRNLGKASF